MRNFLLGLALLLLYDTAYAQTLPFPPAFGGRCPVVFSAPVNIGTGSGGAVAGINITIPAGGVPKNSTIVLVAYDFAGAAPKGSVADTVLNSYSSAISAGAASSLNMFYAFNATALTSGQTITYTKGDSVNGAVVSAFYITSVSYGTDPHDAATNASAAGSSTTPSVASGVGAVSNEMLIAAVGYQSAGTFTQDVGNGWAAPPNALIFGAGSLSIAGGYLVNSGTGSKTFAPTLGTSSAWTEIITSFKPMC